MIQYLGAVRETVADARRYILGAVFMQIGVTAVKVNFRGGRPPTEKSRGRKRYDFKNRNFKGKRTVTGAD